MKILSSLNKRLTLPIYKHLGSQAGAVNGRNRNPSLKISGVWDHHRVGNAPCSANCISAAHLSLYSLSLGLIHPRVVNHFNGYNEILKGKESKVRLVLIHFHSLNEQMHLRRWDEEEQVGSEVTQGNPPLEIRNLPKRGIPALFWLSFSLTIASTYGNSQIMVGLRMLKIFK